MPRPRRSAAGGSLRGARLAALERVGRHQSKAERASAGKKTKQAGGGKKRPRQEIRPTGQNRGKRKKCKFFFLFLIFFQSKFKMKFQLNSKSDFKPINTKYYAIA